MVRAEHDAARTTLRLTRGPTLQCVERRYSTIKQCGVDLRLDHEWFAEFRLDRQVANVQCTLDVAVELAHWTLKRTTRR